MGFPNGRDRVAVPTSVDDYLAALPSRPRAALEKLRETIKAAAPEATKRISYQMPAFVDRGRALVAYGAFKDHCSLFLMSTKVIEAHREELSPFLSGKGTIRFHPERPLPAALVTTLVAARLEERRGTQPSVSRATSEQPIVRLLAMAVPGAYRRASPPGGWSPMTASLALDSPLAAVLVFGPLAGSVVIENRRFRGDARLRAGDRTYWQLQAWQIAGLVLGVLAAREVPGAALPGPEWLWPVLGCAVGLAGVALRRRAISLVGRQFTRHLQVAADRRLVVEGPYAYVRHPSYTGAILMFTGVGSGSGTRAASWPVFSCPRSATSGGFPGRRRSCAPSSARRTPNTRGGPIASSPGSGDWRGRSAVMSLVALSHLDSPGPGRRP